MKPRSRSVFMREPSPVAAWRDRRWPLIGTYLAMTGGAVATLSLVPHISSTLAVILGGLWATYTAALVWRLRWIARRDHPIGHCDSCGYSLTGNVSGVCPECGTP